MRAVVLLALVACKSSTDKEPDKQERVDAALSRVAAIQPRLAPLRGLAFKQPVPASYQSAEDFKKFVRREVTKDFSADKSKRVSAAYLHIGLLAKPVNLATAAIDAISSQAAAYYDPAQKKFFIVAVPKGDMILDTMSAHELTHGLQDQHFDLTKYLGPTPALDDDAQTARQFVTEGDATFAMMVFLAAEASASFDADSVMPVLDQQIERMAGMDVLGDAADRTQSDSFKNLDPDLKRSMDMVSQLPQIIMRPMLESYTKGARLAMVAWKNGGWRGVDALYKTPPESTEQVLHPMTKLIPNRDHPIAVTLPKLDGEELTTNVMGELEWNIYFSLWTPDRALAAAEGWGGDRYTVVKRADGSLVAYLATAWDTAADAKEFAETYQASFAKRFPSSDRKHALKLDDTKVLILDGDDDAKLLDKLASATTFR